MFTAIVLVCAGEFKTPQNCVTILNRNLFTTQNECQLAIEEVISNRIFDYYDETRNVMHTVKDYACVNWKANRV